MRKKIVLNKKIISIASALIGILLIFLIARSCGDEKKLIYEYEKIGYGTIQKTITASGSLQVYGVELVLIKIGGIISNIYVEVNAPVKKGQLLARIDSSGIDQNLERMKRRLESAQLELQKAESDYESKKSMYAENLISKQGMENEELNYKTILIKYKQTKFEYDLAKKDKNNTLIYSPINGVVLSINGNINQPIGTNQEMFKIAPSLKKMLLIIDVDESDIGMVEKNQEVVFSVSAYPDETFKGKILDVNINPINKSGIVSYQSRVLCDNNELKLKPGMSASATVIIKTKKNVLRVLNQAFIVSPVEVTFDETAKYVWRKKSNLIGDLPVERVKVETGLVGNMYTEILKNLKKGDKILIKVAQEQSD
ncbi:MAG TPA: efflux RND transporter periplasmic adaptor subunit [Spirochaetota bacterium]|nr:efflux RND transporter periplasmic adaptor subunit [Spirochaetota bacterium]HPI89976.1 efflux RND transporter periplasmic adaptor subunit [Spirochaetota bacterium]HPR48411.1 efflux RND transporter periplasmic adaptor subunit [Spirochaetota bacterium]